MNKKLLPLLVLAALSSAAHAATPPNTLVVAQGLDDIVSLDPAEANELSSIRTAITRRKSLRFWPKAGKRTQQQKP